MKLLPSSLAARTVLLVIAVVAVAEMTTLSLMFNQGRTDHLRRTVEAVAGQVRLLQTVLPGLDDAARTKLEDAEPIPGRLQLRPDDDFVPRREARFGFARGLARHLERTLGEPVRLRHGEHGSGSSLWIGFDAGGERWWLLLPSPRFEPPGPPRDLWLWLGAALVSLVVIAGLFVRGIVGPLARLGDAVAATGDGRARTVSPEGPEEVKRLAERHNTMVTQLAESDAERSEMLAGLTHDLRAPLARLRVRLALLENDADRSGLARDVDDMERIVGQCLSFLRSEENCTDSEPPLLLADAVSDEVARQRELGRPIEMDVSKEAAVSQVAISHGSLQRLLDNLIDNALQYGQPPIEISLSRQRPGSVTLTVRDHGPGIAPEQRARALEAFAQIEPARATGGSCGLGLAIVRRIVAGCGGEVTLNDAPGGGLAVVLHFPIAT